MIARSKRLCQNVANAGSFDHGTNATASDDTRTRGSRTEKYSATAEFSDHLVRNGVLTNGNLYERFASGLRCLANRFSNFVGFSETAANTTSFVPSYNQCAEGKPTAAFDDFGASIDEDHLLGEIRLLLGSVILRSPGARTIG